MPQRTYSPDRPPAPPLNVLTDSVAIVHRAFLAGEQIPQERWQQPSDYAVQFFPSPGLAFADVHAALAHAMAGNRERLETTIDGAKGPAAPPLLRSQAHSVRWRMEMRMKRLRNL